MRSGMAGSNKGKHLIGKTFGSCVLLKPLGQGGSSTVFLAQQKEPDRKVAVKVFLPHSGMDARLERDFYQRFLREAEAVSQLHHAHILPIYAYGEEDGLPYIVMPYMPGGTLSHYLSRRGPLSLQEAQWYLDQLVAALNYAHDHGCVHCDVKPANILLDSDGQVMLSDFGIARLMDSDGDSTHLLQQEMLLGTPDFISPEQALGRHLDGRSDIYSLGVTLFFMLAKRLPFQARSTIAVALKHVHEIPPSLTQIRANITPLIDQVVQKTLAKNPDERFQTVGELRVAFDHAVLASEKKIPLPLGYLKSIPPEPLAEEQQHLQIQSISGKAKHHPRLQSIIALTVAIFVVLAAAIFAFASTFGLPPHTHAIEAKKTVVTPLLKATVPPSVNPQNLFADQAAWTHGSGFVFRNTREYDISNIEQQTLSMGIYYRKTYSNFHLTVHMAQLKNSNAGSGYYGVAFRISNNSNNYYLFEISNADSIPQYLFLRYDKGSWLTLKAGSLPTFATGIAQTNTLEIVAQQNFFSFQMNGQPIINGSLQDTFEQPLTSGDIGLCVDGPGMEIAFSQISIDVYK